MNAAQLLKLYDRAAEAEDAIPRLRRFVLDLAVRGKLVPQEAGDEPASVLLARIEKATRKPIRPQSGDCPFALPSGWAWSDIGGICSKTGSGSTPRGGKEVYTPEGIPFLRSQNVYDHGLVLNDVAYISPDVHEKMSGTNVIPRDLLLNITGGSMGRCCRVPDRFDGANLSQHVAIIRCAVPEMADFAHALVRSPYFQSFIFGEQTGAGRGGLPKNRMDRIIVAVPPLAEQHRIVAKVEELMALLDRLEAARVAWEEARTRLTAATLSRLTEADTDTSTAARFALQTFPALTTRPDQIKTLRQTILNLAVRGKLVEQDAGDEPASVLFKQIEGITKKPTAPQLRDFPFALPPRWGWSDIAGICSKTGSGSTPRGGKEVYTSEGVAFLRSQNVYDHGLVLNDVAYISSDVHARMSGTAVLPRDLLLNITGGSMGRCCRVPDDFSGANVSQHVAIIRCAIQEMADFMHILVRSPYFQEFIFGAQTGAGRGGLPKNRMDRILVAVPPLAEQHRIVAKVEELMSLCDRLERALQDATTTRARLLDATLREALEGAQDKDLVR